MKFKKILIVFIAGIVNISDCIMPKNSEYGSKVIQGLGDSVPQVGYCSFSKDGVVHPDHPTTWNRPVLLVGKRKAIFVKTYSMHHENPQVHPKSVVFNNIQYNRPLSNLMS